MLEQPLHLGGGKIGIEDEAGARANQRALALLRELPAARRGAPVLPHDRAIERPPRATLPHAHRLALVGDPERRGDHVRLLPSLARRLERDAENVLGVVLHLARVREVLRELAVPAAKHPPVLIQSLQGLQRAPTKAVFAIIVVLQNPCTSPSGPV